MKVKVVNIFMNIYNKMEKQKWYTYKEIIVMCGVCKQTINNWRRSGNIIYKKITNRTFLYQFPETKIIQENESSKNI